MAIAPSIRQTSKAIDAAHPSSHISALRSNHPVVPFPHPLGRVPNIVDGCTPVNFIIFGSGTPQTRSARTTCSSRGAGIDRQQPILIIRRFQDQNRDTYDFTKLKKLEHAATPQTILHAERSRPSTIKRHAATTLITLLLFSRGLARRVFPLFFSITLIFLRTPYSTSSTSTTQRTRSISIAS